MSPRSIQVPARPHFIRRPARDILPPGGGYTCAYRLGTSRWGLASRLAQVKHRAAIRSWRQLASRLHVDVRCRGAPGSAGARITIRQRRDSARPIDIISVGRKAGVGVRTAVPFASDVKVDRAARRIVLAAIASARRHHRIIRHSRIGDGACALRLDMERLHALLLRNPGRVVISIERYIDVIEVAPHD